MSTESVEFGDVNEDLILDQIKLIFSPSNENIYFQKCVFNIGKKSLAKPDLILVTKEHVFAIEIKERIDEVVEFTDESWSFVQDNVSERSPIAQNQYQCKIMNKAFTKFTLGHQIGWIQGLIIIRATHPSMFEIRDQKFPNQLCDKNSRGIIIEKDYLVIGNKLPELIQRLIHKRAPISSEKRTELIRFLDTKGKRIEEVINEEHDHKEIIETFDIETDFMDELAKDLEGKNRAIELQASLVKTRLQELKLKWESFFIEAIHGLSDLIISSFKYLGVLFSRSWGKLLVVAIVIMTILFSNPIYNIFFTGYNFLSNKVKVIANSLDKSTSVKDIVHADPIVEKSKNRRQLIVAKSRPNQVKNTAIINVSLMKELGIKEGQTIDVIGPSGSKITLKVKKEALLHKDHIRLLLVDRNKLKVGANYDGYESYTLDKFKNWSAAEKVTIEWS